MQQDLSQSPDASSSAAIVSYSADATMQTRWRALVLTDAVSRLVRAAKHAQVDVETFDLHQLILAAIDHSVTSRGFSQETTLQQLQQTLADLARRMKPGSPDDTEAQDVAKVVVFGLLNDSREQVQFEYFFTNLKGDSRSRIPYRFRLLELRDGPAGLFVIASEQAITLFLQGLNIDLDDAEVALGVVLQRQLQDKRFEAAQRTAAQAERLTIAMSARLAEVLDDTRRDTHAHDWLEQVPEELGRARAHVRQRIEADGTIIKHVETGINDEDNPVLAAAAGDLIEQLGRIRLVHLDLSSRLAGARNVFIEAQLRQRLTQRKRLRLLDIRKEILTPTIVSPMNDAATVCTAFADSVLSLRQPRIWRFPDLLDALWPPPNVAESADPAEPERPGEIEGEDPQRYTSAVMAAADAVLQRVRLTPTLLSDLLSAAAATDPLTVDGAVDEVIELVALSSLWAYAPDIGDREEEESTEVDSLALNLQAQLTGHLLVHPLAWGDELLVSAAAHLSAPTSHPQDAAA